MGEKKKLKNKGNASTKENGREIGACLSTGFEDYYCKKYLIYNSFTDCIYQINK